MNVQSPDKVPWAAILCLISGGKTAWGIPALEGLLSASPGAAKVHSLATLVVDSVQDEVIPLDGEKIPLPVSSLN